MSISPRDSAQIQSPDFVQQKVCKVQAEELKLKLIHVDLLSVSATGKVEFECLGKMSNWTGMVNICLHLCRIHITLGELLSR